MKTQPTDKKVPVSERAIVARIRRALAKQEMILRRSRGQSAIASLGEWHIVNYHNNLEYDDVDLEVWAKSLKVIAPYEKIV
jgi:hypothetical protein